MFYVHLLPPLSPAGNLTPTEHRPGHGIAVHLCKAV